jgi:glycine dehydrogenase subunit 1
MHPWVGAGPDDRRHLLDELGLDSPERLFATIPPEVCVDRVDLPPGQDEDTVRRALTAVAGRNLTLSSRPSFLGAGVYRHIQPSLVDSVLSRAEFFTSYTPYQPEISQGTLQVIFEFQTLISQLAGCDVANASLYDGATAMVEAVLFSHRVLRGKRQRVLVAESVHPVYRSVLDTYAAAVGLEVVVVPVGGDGRTDPGRLRDERACCVVIQSPSFLGIVEDLPAIADAAHGAGALAVQVVTEAVSLGLLAGGGAFGFDVVCGEAQSFGVAPGFGGPHLGFFACAEKNLRQMPGRLAGETVDQDGRRAFCLTLATREQHIRRAKATSNICTNQALMAPAAPVWLEALGGSGLRELARSNLARAHELKRRIAGLGGGWRLSYPATPTFNEFLVEGPAGGDELARRLADAGVLAGAPSRRWGGSWPDGLLVAVTECNRVADLEALEAAMRRVS